MMNWEHFKKKFLRAVEHNPQELARVITFSFLGLGIVLPSLIVLFFWPSTPTFQHQIIVNNSPQKEPIQPIPMQIALDYQKVTLGKKLFFDKRLSKDNSISCASCHDFQKGGTDHQKTSDGFAGAKGPINAPTVFNSALNFRQFWDGRAANLEEQALGPINNPKEMNTDITAVIGKLAKDAEYNSLFRVIYKDTIKASYIANAIAEFEKSLSTPNSSFDQYLRGDKNAIDQEELEGYQLFKSLGCISCHQGVGIGGNMYQTFGVTGNYFQDRGNIQETDYGLYNRTKKEEDKFKFKVPSLRNIAVTAPYLHDGSQEKLEDVVYIMSVYQLGKTLNKDEVGKIVKFLRTLTGEYKGKKLQ